MSSIVVYFLAVILLAIFGGAALLFKGYRPRRKTAYICGPLTELPLEEQAAAKKLYEDAAEVVRQVTGMRAFVPHEHYDPVKHADFSPKQVDAAERRQVSEETSVLIVFALAPSWGGGIEVEIANDHDVPGLLFCERKKLEARKISRLLRGNPAFKKLSAFDSYDDALKQLEIALREMFHLPRFVA